jgi:hypothetical protein
VCHRVLWIDTRQRKQNEDHSLPTLNGVVEIGDRQAIALWWLYYTVDDTQQSEYYTVFEAVGQRTPLYYIKHTQKKEMEI